MAGNWDVDDEAITSSSLDEYATVPTAFLVRSRLRVELLNGGLGGLALTEEAVEPPWIKDYDAEQESPIQWAGQADTTNWVAVVARHGDHRIGGALVWDNAGKAELFDIQVRPDFRGLGVGRELFQRALAWATSKGGRMLTVETQNINVPACRFYAAQGCELSSVNRHAYAALPDEIQLIWTISVGDVDE